MPIAVPQLHLFALLLILMVMTFSSIHGCIFGTKRVLTAEHVKTIQALGCYSDKLDDRDLLDFVGRFQKMRKLLCNSYCAQRSAKYFGMQDGEACYCGNSYGKYGRMTEVYCDKKCVGDSGERCGGERYNSVYEVNDDLPTVDY